MSLAPEDLVGRTLAGRYRLVRLVGEGGIGQVYEAEQIDLARRVAVKVLRVQNAMTIARFRKEARAASMLRHPNVVSVLDFQALDGEPPFLVMELLEGESLAALGRREAPLAPKRAVDIAIQILSGLAAAHAAGLVHRDVKPGNVWIAKTLAGETVKLLDFGLVLSEDVRLTKTGEVIGTPSFQAPEQLRGEAVDARADIHAVGVVVYMLLAGRLPWTDSAAPHGEILGRVPRPLGDMVPGLARGLSDVIDKALRKVPADRYASAAEMVDALVPFAGTARASRVRLPPAETLVSEAEPPELGSAPRASARTRPRTKRGLPSLLFLGGMASAMAVVLAILGVVTWRRASARRRPLARPQEITAPAPAVADAGEADASPPRLAPEVDEHGDAGEVRRQPHKSDTLRFATAADRTTCECFADISPGRNRNIGRAVCAIPKAPRCRCVMRDRSMTLCSRPRNAEQVCLDPEDTYVASQEGKDCRGTTSSGHEDDGVVECDRCWPPRTYAGVTHGTSCRGVHDGPRFYEGVWRCTTTR